MSIYIAHRRRKTSNVCLPRDAMHKRGLCRCAVSVCHVRALCRNG